MRFHSRLGAAVGLTAVLVAAAAPPPEFDPRITTETPPRWSMRDRRWPQLDYLKGRPRLPDHPRPPPPEYAFWYWAKEKQARERGDPDPWLVRERKLEGYPHPQPGVALGEGMDDGRSPERPAPRAVRQLRRGRSEGAAVAADPLTRARYREPRPGDVYEVHSPWCAGPPRPLCHGERRPPPPGEPGEPTGGSGIGGGDASLFTGVAALGGAAGASVDAALGATLGGAGAQALLAILDDLLGNRRGEPRALPPDVVAVVEERLPEIAARGECASLPPWETPPKGDCGHEPPKAPGKPRLPPAVPKDREGMRALGEALATRPPDACHQSCVGCHAGPCGTLKGTFPRFPAYHGGVNRIIGIEEQVNLCRAKRQDLAPLRPDSPAMAAVLVYLRDLE